MPEDHQKYLEWNGDRFRRWASQIGPCTEKVINSILTSGRVEQQSYRSCMGLLKMAERLSAGRLEAACEKALCYTDSPSYKGVKNILAAGEDISDKSSSIHTSESHIDNPHALTRGAAYYRR